MSARNDDAQATADKLLPLVSETLALKLAERGFDLTWLLARRTARGLARLGVRTALLQQGQCGGCAVRPPLHPDAQGVHLRLCGKIFSHPACVGTMQGHACR